jgi:HD domain
MTLIPSGAINAPPTPVADVTIPDSKLAHEVTELVKDTESPLLFHHSSRVYYWGALTGRRRGLRFDPELLYASAMFHDMGLTPLYASADNRFEVDSANTARDFLRSHGIDEQDIETVWTAIALHTTPGIPQYMHPVIALVTAGVEMDVLGIAFPSSLTPSAKPWSSSTRAPVALRKRSSRPFTTAFITGLKRPSATSTPMCSPTRIPPSGR